MLFPHSFASFSFLSKNVNYFTCSVCVCVFMCVLNYVQLFAHLCPWNFPGKNTGVGCHFILQGIFLIQGSNPCLLCLLHWQANSSPLLPPQKPPLLINKMQSQMCLSYINLSINNPTKVLCYCSGSP